MRLATALTSKKAATAARPMREAPAGRGPTLRAGLSNQSVLHALASGQLHFDGTRVSAARISSGVRAAGIPGPQEPHRCAACASEVEEEATRRVDDDSEDDLLPYPRAVEA